MTKRNGNKKSKENRAGNLKRNESDNAKNRTHKEIKENVGCTWKILIISGKLGAWIMNDPQPRQTQSNSLEKEWETQKM